MPLYSEGNTPGSTVESWGLTLDRGPETCDGLKLDGGTHPGGGHDLEDALNIEGYHEDEGFALEKSLTLGPGGPIT